jgi:hypothetical protein
VERALRFEDAGEVLSGPTHTIEDARADYGETRFVSFGYLARRMMVVVWTPRGKTLHVISFRKANDREQDRYAPLLQGR